MGEEDEARRISPFKMIHRGDDTIDDDENVLFADFSPRLLPADTPEPPELTDIDPPKEESAPEPVFSEPETSPQPTELQTLESPVPTSETETTDQKAAEEDAGNPNPNESGSQTSSTKKKRG